ncbi:MAG: C25 family cysteine peptidase [Bacteroidota bacterium]
MKKYGILLGTLLLFVFNLQAQPFDYGNQWYKANSTQSFIELAVWEDGVYRVYPGDFQQAGFDLSAVNPDFLQLYYRGKEIPLYVEKAGGTFSYLEFYGKRNDGGVDSIMYRDPISGKHNNDLQPNRDNSIYSDTAVYFLTWGTVPSGNRYFSNLDPTYNLYTPVPHFQYETKRGYHPDEPGVSYVVGGGGQYDSFYSLNCDYVTGEGYVGPSFGIGGTRVIPMETPASAGIGDSVRVQFRVFGRSKTQHRLKVKLNNNDSYPVIDTTIQNSQVYIKTYARNYLPATSLGATTDLTFEALQGNTDNNQLCWASISYRRLPDMNGDSTIVIQDWSSNTKSYFRLNNVIGDDTIYVYDPVHRFRSIGLINNSNIADVIVQGFGNPSDLIVVSDRAIKKPKISGTSLNSLFNRGGEYVIITHRTLAASAAAFANYRDTATVNPVASTAVVYVDEIYDEYGYGTITPWAIKRFCKDAIDNWNVKPKYFMLWGKGRYRTRGIAPDVALVPTYGFPATDYEFVTHFDQQGIDLEPEAAIGRINLFNNDEGMTYLDKVNDYEHTDWDTWMKEGVFLGGGDSPGEQNAISSAFDFMIEAFEATPFGGLTHYFQKRSGDIVVDPTNATYHDEISQGVRMIHFFGHSTSNILDVSLRQPFEYNNFGKYPFMIAMGCYGGDFTVPEHSFGENWVLQPQRGSIGYLGNSSAGYLNPLRDYGRNLYRFLYDQRLGKPIGQIIQEQVFSYTDSLSGIQFRNHARQMNLQGDPAIILYHEPLPDLSISQSSIFFNPENFTAQDDSFRINVIVTNQGLTVEDSIRIEIRQRLPDNRLIIHPSIKRPITVFRDTLSLVINNVFGNGLAGPNQFEIFVDADEVVTEYNENNNRLNLDVVVPGNIPAILFPREYAIIPNNQVSLQASAFFMTQADDVGFIFEIDTSATFSSPLMVNSGVITGNATFVSWDVPFNLMDSTVYFWRVRLAQADQVVWGNSSFKYIANRTGWAQAKFEQFLKDPLDQINLQPLQRKWQYNSFGQEFEFATRINGSFAYFINNNQIVDLATNGFSGDGVAFLIIDQKSLSIEVITHFYGAIGVTNAPGGLYKVRDAILSAEDGDYVMVASHNNPHVPQWPDEIFEALKLIGVSDNMRLLNEGDAFILFGQKGQSGGATEIFNPTVGDKLVLNRFLFSFYSEGKVSSTRIGPAMAWDQVFWGWETLDETIEEDIKVNVYGVRQDATEVLLQTDLSAGTHGLNTIDADLYPFLRLEAATVDTVFRTAPQLDNWHVVYSPAPDGVVDLQTDFEFRSDTLFQGQDVYLRMAAKNISDVNMDSVLVYTYIEREDRTQLPLDTFRIAPLIAGGASVPIEVTYNTLEENLEGSVKLIVELNPDNDQTEQYLFNNIYSQPFYVLVDRFNPLMDVTFDGKHIIDGDIVSPDPEILVEVNDENPLIALDDTTSFELYFKRGTLNTGSTPRIFLDDPRVVWVPATLPQNKAQLFFYPGRGVDGFLEDDEYVLKVQGRDKQGNTAGSGNNTYEITFRVENESSITRILNYPNPFSTSTRFVYTLAGAQVPEVFQIHIYTISGKLVKVIDLAAEGDVAIGQNITNYAWDGTDEYGDKLANGVYLYKTIIQMPGEQVKNREVGIDKFFNNDWGKMYIMR